MSDSAKIRSCFLLLILLVAAASAGAQSVVYDIAGNQKAAWSGDGGPATSASLNAPASIALDGAGNLYIADMLNNVVRKVTPTGVITTVAGTGVSGSLPGDGVPATSSPLMFPTAVAIDPNGTLYIADRGHHRIRRVGADGIIVTVAGDGFATPAGGGRFSGDGGGAAGASLNHPSAIAFDPAGNLYIADTDNLRVRLVTLDGRITTVAGNGGSGFYGDGSPATMAQLSFSSDCYTTLVPDCQGPGIAVDKAGNLYIADRGNNRIRKVTKGIINTIAGNGSLTNSGDGGSATDAGLDRPMGVAVDSAGNVYIAASNSIRKIDPKGIIPIISTIDYRAGDPAATLLLQHPFSLVIQSEDIFLVADKGNNLIRKFQPVPQLTLQPASLDFVAFAGMGNPPAQTLKISNAVNGALVWNAQAVSLTGGNWLSVSPSSGAAPATMTVTANATGLALGSYDGKIVFTNNLDTTTSKTVPVRLTIAPPSTLVLGASTLSFSGVQGGANPSSQAFTVSNSGTALPWTATATSSGNWLSVSPGSGTGAATLTVSVNLAGLNGGTYTGTIQVSAPLATNTPQSINVALTVITVTAPTLALTPASLQFSASTGVNPATQTLDLKTLGGGALGWTASVTTQSGGDWLSVTPATGVTPSTLTVNVNSSSLAVGSYSGTITVAALPGANVANSPQLAKVSLSVGIPTIGDGGLVNGASFAKNTAVAPGSIVSLFGTNLAADTAAATALPLPTTLAGTQVLVNGVNVTNAAPLFFVSPSQINFQMPFETADRSAAQVVVMSGTISSQPAFVKISPEYPGIFFTFVSAGTGPGAVLNQDFTANSAQTPAPTGSVIQIFATGLGVSKLSLATNQPGASSAPFHETVAQPVVLIGGTVTRVLFSAVAPGFVGLYQVNAVVPAGTAGKAVPLQVLVNGRPSNTVTIAVK